MGRVEVRLECLRLANRVDKDDSYVVERAKAFEAYVYENCTGGGEPKPVDYLPEVKTVGNSQEPTDLLGKASPPALEEAKPVAVHPKGKHRR